MTGYESKRAAAQDKLAQPAQEQLMSDQINYGMSVTQGGRRIDPMSIYKEPEQEPVAWMHPVNKACVTTDPTAYARGIPLYATPPQRPWVGLAQDEQMQIWDGIIKYAPSEMRIKDFAQAIEVKLKEKNT